MSLPNVGLCSKCQGRVNAEFFTRDNQVWIRKDCKTCGVTESLVSGDAKAWYAKRELWSYVPEQPQACTLHCDKCRHNHKPNLVFLDVTNHCNMNCPICIASIKAMGFDYNPPIEYLEKIFAHVSKWDPPPTIQLFGGEPTTREDFFEICRLVRKHGLRPNLTTNGLRLADEDYCRKICDARIGMRFAFDGFGRDIYEKLRHNGPAYDKKLKALENLKKYTRRKQAIISCIARDVNDGPRLTEMVQYIHDNRDWISELLLIPLAETWDPEVFHEAKPNTLEDCEKMLADAIGDGGVEFIPAGLSYMMRIPRRFLRSNPRSEILLLAGVHPNCESMTVLISDGKRFRGINHYMKVPFRQAAARFAELCKKIEPKLDKLDPKKRWQRFKGQMLIARTFTGWALGTFKLGKLTGYNPLWALAKFMFSRAKSKLARRLHPESPAAGRRKRGMLRVAMLPFEEQHSVDATRLENCKAVFVYEDENGQMQNIPTCMWPPYRNIVLKKVAAKYGVVDKNGEMRKNAFGLEQPVVVGKDED